MDLRVAILLLSSVVPVFSKTVDYYAILGVQRHADETEIRSAFKSLAKIWHPDKMDEIESWGGSERFIAIREAYEVLSNSVTREIYNRNNPEAGLHKSWWGALIRAYDELTISLKQSEQQRKIAEKSKDFLLQYELFTFRLFINAVFEVPTFLSKLENAVSNLKHIKREAKYKTFDNRNWWDLKNSFSAKSVRAFFKILGLSSLCLISKYLSRGGGNYWFKSVKMPPTSYPCQRCLMLKGLDETNEAIKVKVELYRLGFGVRVVQGLFFFGNLPIFPVLLAVYILLLAWKKNAFVVAFALAFGEMAIYRTFISPTLSYIWHDVDEFVKVHQTDIFIYIVLATIVSFPVFLKYRTRCQFFSFCICAMSHIALCTTAFKVMTFSDAVSFFVCLTILVFLIDKVSTILAVLIYLLVQMTSGVYTESSPELFALTIGVTIISWPLSYFYKDSRKWSLCRWISTRFLRRKAGGNTQQNETAEKKENNIFFTNELNFYFTLTAVCLSMTFIYEFY